MGLLINLINRLTLSRVTYGELVHRGICNHYPITLTADSIRVGFQKRAHNPLLLAAGFDETDIVVPWLGGKRLQFSFG